MGMPGVGAMGMALVRPGYGITIPRVCHGYAVGIPRVCRKCAMGVPRICYVRGAIIPPRVRQRSAMSSQWRCMHSCATFVRWVCQRCAMHVRCACNSFATVPRRVCHEYGMNTLWLWACKKICHRACDGSAIVLLGVCHGYAVPWVRYGSAKSLPWVCHGHLTNPPRVRYWVNRGDWLAPL